MPALSVILTTYNKPRDLERVLEGFRHQTTQDFELLVCDDGSGPETRAVIETFGAGVPFPVEHVWQEDQGFRAARSRNNGARRAQGPTLVFVDGDCVPEPGFLAAHAQAQEPRRFQAGERWMLEEDEAQLVTVAAIASGQAFRDVPQRERRRVKSVRFKDRLYRLTGMKPDRPRLMTSNASMPLAAFQAVNGLDERYEGWGQEDEDLRRRLVRRGYTPGSVIGEANCIHLWHKSDPSFRGARRNQPNWAYYERGFQLSRCRRGLVERPLAELAWRITAPQAELAERAKRALGLPQTWQQGDDPPEVELILDPGEGPIPGPQSPAAEVVVRLLASSPGVERVVSGDVVLGPELALAGGELPGESFPEVAEASDGLKLSAQATRPIPPGLDDDALTAAVATLDSLL